ncbi:MAG: NTP transferase domain-containing protein [Bacillus subtilis]|nr:NTP transferase domain-containing protein [Bacillus subtilis]
MKRYAIVLAAGKGTRMKTELPKCAYPLLKKPMIAYIIENVQQHAIPPTRSSSSSVISAKSSRKSSAIRVALCDPGGTTRHRARGQDGRRIASSPTSDGATIMILPGDMPLVDTSTIERAFHEHYERRNDLTVVTTQASRIRSGYGRILRDESGYLTRIIEHHEANPGATRRSTRSTPASTSSRTTSCSTALGKDRQQQFQEARILPDRHRQHHPFRRTTIHRHLFLQGFRRRRWASTTSIRSRSPKPSCALAINQQHMDDLRRRDDQPGHDHDRPQRDHRRKRRDPSQHLHHRQLDHQEGRRQIGPNTEIHESIIGERVLCRHSLVFNSIVHEDTTDRPVRPSARRRQHRRAQPHRQLRRESRNPRPAPTRKPPTSPTSATAPSARTSTSAAAPSPSTTTASTSTRRSSATTSSSAATPI